MLDQTPKTLYQVRPQTHENSRIKSESQETQQAGKLRYLSKSRGCNYPQNQLLTTKNSCSKKTMTKLLAG